MYNIIDITGKRRFVVKKEIKGLYTALVTPYDKKGRVNLASLEGLVKLNKLNGITRFYVCGSAAEMTQLSLEERKEILRTVLACGCDYVIAHVGGENAKSSIELAKDAQKCGADAISAVTPYYYKYTFEEIKSYYKRLHEESGLPVVVYSIPTYSGVSFSSSQIEELLNEDYVDALKFTVRDTYLIERAKSVGRGAKPIFNGCDEILTSGLIAGADGAIGAMYNVLSDKATKIFSAFKEGNLELCGKIQSQINEIISVTSSLGGLKCVKALLDLMGYEVGNLRAPFMPLGKEQYKRLEREILPKITLKTN